MAVIYDVSQVTAYLQDLLAYDDLLRDIWIEGEVSNLRRAGSGHAYFSLRDGSSSLRCALFRNSLGHDHLADGALVIAHGRVSLYAVRGDLQLIADVIQPEGVGRLQIQLEQLRAQLEREGLFDPSRKRPLPEFPRRIGVVTSPSGAVWHDIQTVIGRRYPLVELALAPVLVQGDAAAPTIAEAIVALNAAADIDAIIVARGGGSLEDLWAFNEEVVARAVFASRAPVVSAVGHETDVTICDLVADVRAATPSEAAEMVVPDRADLLLRVSIASQTIEREVAALLAVGEDETERLLSRMDRAAPSLDDQRIRVDELLEDAGTALDHRLQLAAARVKGVSAALASLSPVDTLRRGYSVVSDRASGRVLTDAGETDPGGAINITLHRGSIMATVESTSPVGATSEKPPEEVR